MTQARPFRTMRGLEILSFVRDELLDEADVKRRFVERCEAHAAGSTDPAMRQRVAAIAAATDAFTFIIGAAQDEARKHKTDPKHHYPNWLNCVTAQTREALIAPKEADEPQG